jgi:hypothetical protein
VLVWGGAEVSLIQVRSVVNAIGTHVSSDVPTPLLYLKKAGNEYPVLTAVATCIQRMFPLIFHENATLWLSDVGGRSK